MYKGVKLCFFIVLVMMTLSGCTNFNPFIPPDEWSQNAEDKVDQNKYMDEIDNMLNKNENITDEKADEFSEKFKNKTDSVYYNAIERFQEHTINRNENDPPVKAFLRGFYTTYNNIRLISPVIVIISIVFGVIGMLFSRYNKGARRFFLVAFVIVIPLLIVIFIFGVGILNSMFLYD